MNVTFVDWRVDDAHRLIEVTVRIDVWIPDADRALIANLLKKIFPAVEQKWAGKFKCYDFRLKIDWREVPSLDKVRADALDVRVSDSNLKFGYTKSHGPDDVTRASASDDPKDQVVPDRNPSDQSLTGTTAWPPAMNTISTRSATSSDSTKATSSRATGTTGSPARVIRSRSLVAPTM